MKSIIQDKKECFICKKTYNLHCHHCFFGANRKHSEKYGLTIWLCLEHHTGSKISPHFDRKIDLEIKKLAQKEFEKTHTREEFMRIFGRNYDV